MKTKNIFKVLALSGALMCTSCDDFLSQYSQDMIIAKQVTDLDEVMLVDVYLPSYEMSYGPTSSVGGFFNLLDDDINTAHAMDVSQSQASTSWRHNVAPLFGYFAWQLEVGTNYQKTNKADDSGLWNDLYHRINVVNMILNEIEDLPHEAEEDYLNYLRVKGECYFCRAQFYFTLANLYGDAYSPATCDTKLAVPLKLTYYVEHDKNKDTQFQRATVKQVYDQVVEDLLLAVEHLELTPQKADHRLHRASAEAAYLLLSRVYLYMQNYSGAELAAKMVMDSNNCSLSTRGEMTPGVTFLTTSNPEVIFSQGSNFLTPTTVLTGQGADYCVTMDLYTLYDTKNDHRATTFFRRVADSDSIGLTNKYEKGSNLRSHISDCFLLRKAEAYLNYAEACAMQGGGHEQDAVSALNYLRSQRIDNYTAQTYSGAELVDEIRTERRKELCFEGHRWFDLRRYAVCEQYPYSRNIVHVVNVHDDENRNIYLLTLKYVLPAGDPAYTFQIPKSVLEFDEVPMEENLREPRPALKEEEPEEEKKDPFSEIEIPDEE